MPDALWRPSISVVVPAHNEARSLEATVRGTLRVLHDMDVDHELVVVDDGSRDGTGALCTRLMTEAPALRLAAHDRNEGYGRAVWTGIQCCRKDVIVLLPADLQYSFHEIPRLVALTADCDIVAGCRVSRADPFVRRLNARCWGVLVRAVVGVRVKDVNGGFKVFRRSVFDGLEMRATGAMIDTEIFARTARRGARILETPVEHHPRRAGRATGARPSVILRSCYELLTLYRELRR